VQAPADLARIALVDTGTGRVTDAPLPVRAGWYPDEVAAAEEPFRSVEPGLAWDLPREKLYVADADSDRVFVMDLRTGTVAGPFEPKPKRSMLDVLWSLFGSVADAKIASTSRQHAVVTPDGSRLYVTGLRSDFAKGTDGKYHESVTPLQLRVIDLSDMTELARLDGATTPLWMSPEGSVVLFGNNRYDTSVEGYAARSGFRLHLLDGERQQDVAVSVDGDPFVVGFDAKSRTAYVRIQHFSANALSVASLALVDLAARRVITERVMDRHFADVLLVGGP
jgi:DNA-binding beta-propeller fold protein YncE